MAYQPEQDPLAAWWQGLAVEPMPGLAPVEAPIVVPTPPPEIEMPAQDARPFIGFPRAVEEPAPIEMPAMDARTGMPAMPEPAIGGLQPGLGIPTGAVDDLMSPMPDALSGADPVSPLAAHNIARNEMEMGSERFAELPLPYDAPTSQENEMQRRGTLDDYEATLEDRTRAATEQLDDRDRLADLLKQDGEARAKADQRHREMREAARAERAQIDAQAKELAEKKVGASDWYDEGGIGRSVGAMLVAALGGLVQHLNGGRNLGLESVNRSIDRFIAARQADRDHKRAMLGDRRRSISEQMAEDDAAYREDQATRQAALERTKYEIETMQQSFDPASVRAAELDNIKRGLDAEILTQRAAADAAREKEWQGRYKFATEIEDNQRKRDEARMKQEKHNAEMRKLAGAGGGGAGKPKPEDQVMPPEYYAQRGLAVPPVPMSEKQHKAWLPQKKASQEIAANESASGRSKEEKENSIPGIKNPDGSTFIAAGRPEDISKARDQIGAAKLIIKRMDDALRTRTGWSSDAGNSDERKKLQAQWGNVKVDAKNLLDLGAITAADVPLIEGVVGTDDPSSWKDPQAGIIEARRLIEDRVDTKLRSLGYEGDRWSITAPSTKRPEKVGDDYILERAQSKDVGSYTSFGDDMKDQRGKADRASNAEVRTAYESGSGIPPGIQKAIDRWGSEARGEGPGSDVARARLASLTETGGNDAVKAAAASALRYASESEAPIEAIGVPDRATARDTIAAPPPRKGKR